MRTLSFALVKWLAGLLISVVALAWLFLALPAFSGVRSALVAELLTRQFGQQVTVDGENRAILGLRTSVRVTGVSIPSENIEGLALASLASLEFDIDLLTLLVGPVVLDNLRVEGAAVRLVTLSNGTRSWSDKESLPDNAGAADTKTLPEPKNSILAFLSDKTLAFSSIQILVDDQTSGFQFDFELEKLALVQLDRGRLTTLEGGGRMNGSRFEIEGTFPRQSPFSLQASVGTTRISLDGRPIPADVSGSFSGHLILDVGELGDFLEAVGLARAQEGKMRVAADIVGRPGLLQIDGLDAVVNFSGGQEATAKGFIGNLWMAADFDISTRVRLHPEGSPPPPAAKLREVQFAGIDARIVAENGELWIEHMMLRTNAFDQGLDHLGPASIGRVFRSPVGRLVFSDIRMRAGPEEAPYLSVMGEIGDALRLRELAFDGTATIPSSLLVANLSDDDGDFGSLRAEFSIDDSDGHPGLKRLQARSADTNLWTLEASASWPDVTELGGGTIALDLAVKDSAAFLSGLGLKPLDTNGFSLRADLESTSKQVQSAFEVAAGDSQLDVGLDVAFEDDIPIIRGNMTSERLALADLRNVTAFLVELGRIGEGPPMEGGRELQPLVLEDTREVQPLVLEDARHVQPLVLPKREGIAALADLIDSKTLLRETDLEFAIEIPRITGQRGVSNLSSTLTAKDGQVRLGPIGFSYGGGFFDFSAGMDLVTAPDSITISGSTAGWNFGEILKSVGVEIGANGALKGRFDLTGRFSGLSGFARSASGAAQVSMSQGTIDSSLLELAGLGIFRWLFSGELQRGSTRITCLEAPLQIQSGKITSNAAVVETEKVQVVIRGTMDFGGDRISLRAEPRPLGKPLARSAWPFELNGRLSDPDYRVLVGGVRPRGANRGTRMPADRIPCKPDILQLQ